MNAESKDTLREKILAIKDWRHPYDLGDGVHNDLILPFFKEWNQWRVGFEFDVLPRLCEGFDDMVVADLGCNDGFFSFEFAKRGAKKVIGIEARQETVDKANLIKDYFGHENVEFRCDDIEFFKFQEEYPKGFDIVIAHGLLYHLSNPIQILRRFHTLTKKVLSMQTFIVGSDKPVLELYDEPVKLPSAGTQTLVCRPSQSAVYTMLFDAGFDFILRVCPRYHRTKQRLPAFAQHGKHWHLACFYAIKTESEAEKDQIRERLGVTRNYNPGIPSTQVIELGPDTPPLFPEFPPLPFRQRARKFVQKLPSPLREVGMKLGRSAKS